MSNTQLTSAIADLRHLYANLTNGAVRDTASAKRIAEGILSRAIQKLETVDAPIAITPEMIEVGYAAPEQLKGLAQNPSLLITLSPEATGYCTTPLYALKDGS